MKTQQAIEIAKEMQRWRRSEGEYENGADMPCTPKEFGEAIDTLIESSREEREGDYFNIECVIWGEKIEVGFAMPEGLDGEEYVDLFAIRFKRCLEEFEKKTR